MKQVEISYGELEQFFIDELSKLGSEGLYQRGILATSAGDHVTARRVRLVADGLSLYMRTDRGTRKCEQITANPNVAVVAGFIQIEGIASLKGHPHDEPDFLKAYKQTQPESYEEDIEADRAEDRERDMVVIEIAPKRIALDRYADPAAGIERGRYVLNVAEGEAHRIFDVKSMQSDPDDAPAYRR